MIINISCWQLCSKITNWTLQVQLLMRLVEITKTSSSFSTQFELPFHLVYHSSFCPLQSSRGRVYQRLPVGSSVPSPRRKRIVSVLPVQQIPHRNKTMHKQVHNCHQSLAFCRKCLQRGVFLRGLLVLHAAGRIYLNLLNCETALACCHIIMARQQTSVKWL